MKINRTINALLILCVMIYVIGLTSYTWLGVDRSNPAEITVWDKFYFVNDNFIKVVFPLLISFLVLYKPLKLIIFSWSIFQGVIFIFSAIKLFFGFSNLVLYKFTTLTTLLILIYAYVRCRRIFKE